MAQSVCVLHVDDDPDFTDMVATFLERENPGINVRMANITTDGLDILADYDIDCVVSDYDMPRMNGIEFLEAVRDEYPELPFILFTGKGSEVIASEAITAGVTDYLQKQSSTEQYELLANKIVNVVSQFRATKTAERAQRRLGELAEKTHDVLWMFSADWEELLFINSSYEEIWGQDTDLIRERPSAFLEAVHPDDRNRAEQAMQHLSEGESQEIELRVNPKEDYQRYVWIQAEPIIDERKEVARIVGFGRDITSRKEREQRYNAIFNQTYQFTGLLEPDGTLIEANETALEFGGIERDDVIGKKMWEATWFNHSQETKERAREAVKRAAEGEFVRHELPVIGEESEAIIDFSVRPVTNDQGDVTLLIPEGRDITERKERERELQRYEAYLQESSDIITVLDDTGTVTYQSPAVERILGYERDQFIGQNGFDYIHPDDVDEVWETFTDLVAEPGTTVTVECRFRSVNDEWRWLEVHATNRLEHDAINGIVTNNRDITERKERENRLRALNERTNHLVAADTREQISELSVEAASEVFGLDANAIHLYDDEQAGLVPVAGTDEIYDLVGNLPVFTEGDSIAWRVYDNGETLALDDVHDDPNIYNPETPIRSELYLPLGDHGILIAGSETPAAFDQQDVVFGEILADTIATTLDRINRELALRQNEARYRSLTDDVLDTSDVGTFILDADFEVVWINEATEEYFGIDRDAVVGADKRQLIHDHVKHTVEDSEGFATTVLATYDDNTYVEEFDCHVLPADKRDERWLKHWSQPIESGLYEGGRIEHYTDITEAKHRERELSRQNERLEQFARIVSHDLRNPLSVAEGQLELARDECDSEHLDDIVRAHERMNDLIDDLLTLAQQSETVSKTEPLDLVHFIENCWRNVVTDEVTLTTNVERTITADQSRLQQLLENLIRNAVEHGGTGVTVTIGELNDGFYVEDDGPGIPENKRDEVFEAGYSTAEDGTGFGLSIVKQVAKAHNWEIRVTKASQGGARFEVTGVNVVDE